MKCALQAITALGVIEMVGATDTLGRIMDEAADRADTTANFLEEIEEAIKEKDNDLSVQ